jgi:hypothetical protein
LESTGGLASLDAIVVPHTASNELALHRKLGFETTSIAA